MVKLIDKVFFILKA